LVTKTLEDGWYVVINAYKFTVCGIWGDFFVLSYYCVSVPSLHIESTDSMLMPVTAGESRVRGAEAWSN